MQRESEPNPGNEPSPRIGEIFERRITGRRDPRRTPARATRTIAGAKPPAPMAHQVRRPIDVLRQAGAVESAAPRGRASEAAASNTARVSVSEAAAPRAARIGASADTAAPYSGASTARQSRSHDASPGQARLAVELRALIQIAVNTIASVPGLLRAACASHIRRRLAGAAVVITLIVFLIALALNRASPLAAGAADTARGTPVRQAIDGAGVRGELDAAGAISPASASRHAPEPAVAGSSATAVTLATTPAVTAEASSEAATTTTVATAASATTATTAATAPTTTTSSATTTTATTVPTSGFASTNGAVVSPAITSGAPASIPVTPTDATSAAQRANPIAPTKPAAAGKPASKPARAAQAKSARADHASLTAIAEAATPVLSNVIEPTPAPEPAAPTPEPAPPVVDPCAALAGLAAAQCRACGELGRLQRGFCQQRVRNEFCVGRYGLTADCPLAGYDRH